MSSLVSIILPVYNGELYLAEAMKSILMQDYQEWELLVINDGSQDTSGEIANSFRDSRIRYFEQSNKGVSAARNVGLKNMKGEYFCFIDADDCLPKESLSLRVPLFEDKEVAFVDGNVDSYDSTMTVIKKTFKPTFQGSPVKELLRLSSSCFFGITWMIRRSNLESCVFREGLKNAEELLFYTELASRGGKYTYVAKTIYNRRIASISAMANFRNLADGYVDYYTSVKTMGIATEQELRQLRRKIEKLLIKFSIRSTDPTILKRLWRL